jgi:hypothetical protein
MTPVVAVVGDLSRRTAWPAGAAIERGYVRAACEQMFVSTRDQDSRDVEIRCARCRLRKPPEAFNWRRRERAQRDTYCRACRAEYKHEHYSANKQRYVNQAASSKRKLQAERMTFLIEYLRSRGCLDCGETDPLVLEFDHRGAKAFNVCSALNGRRWETVLSEIEKCDVRCTNCHRPRTAR